MRGRRAHTSRPFELRAAFVETHRAFITVHPNAVNVSIPDDFLFVIQRDHQPVDSGADWAPFHFTTIFYWDQLQKINVVVK